MADNSFLVQLLTAEQKAATVRTNAKTGARDKTHLQKDKAKDEVDAFVIEKQAELERISSEAEKANAVSGAQTARYNAQQLSQVESDFAANKMVTAKYIIEKVRDVNLTLTPTQILALSAEIVPVVGPKPSHVMPPMEAKEQLKLVKKEAGERGVELEGASMLGNTRFFATCLSAPRGDLNLLLESMTAMNAPAPKKVRAHGARAGGSGDVAKMIFSCNYEQVAAVAYVPVEIQDRLIASAWIEEVMDWFGGEVKSSTPGQAAGVAEGEGAFMLQPLKQKATEILVRLQLMAEDHAHDGDDGVFGDEDLPGIPADRRKTILAKRRSMRASIV